MPEKYTYLLVDLCCIFFPFICSFYRRINFYKQWKFFIFPCLSTALIFIIWDIIFTRAGVWSFNQEYICGISYFGLPIEEYLFFICIPYACVFTYHCVKIFLVLHSYQWASRFSSAILIVGLLLVAAFHIPLLYTSVTFIALAFFLALILLVRVSFLPTFFISFLLIQLPFFISNGILTGSIIAAPVVFYNGNYNLGIRLFTIPFEDIFYGMLLFLMNVAGYEYLLNKTVRK